ncbi:MAG: 50S ribosomal protein L13, partial [Candidatus Methanofastidiosia archaeon]
MIVNAQDLILGRLASYVAKRLLEGEEVIVVNAKLAVITGRKEFIVSKYKKRIERRTLSNPKKGPKFPKTPDGIVRRAIRGMLPYKKPRGRQAFKKLKVFSNMPSQHEKFDEVEIESIEGKTSRFLRISKLSEALGYRV